MEKKFFKELFNNTMEGILIIKEGFIEDINSAMLTILDYNKKDDVIGKLATGILIPNTHKKYLEYNNELYEEVSLVSKDAKIVPAIIKIKDLTIENVNYKLVFIQNLTELKNKEMLLLEQSRMAAMGEMISMIAHQWRQPLSSIAAATSNLKFRINLEKYEKDIFNNKLSDIDKYLQYMSNTIDDFRNFFKSKKEKELVSLNEVVENCLEMIEKAFENHNIKIINNTKPLTKIHIFKNELLQVILNVFNNSKDAFKEQNMTSQASVTINYEDLERYQIIEICDNAGGIKEDIIDKIFDPYFSTKDKKNGTGIGLYMCKVILEKHCDGEISATNLNGGACFKIKISK